MRTATTAALRQVCDGCIPPDDPSDFPRKSNLQAIIYESVMLHAVTSDPSDTILKRVRDLFAPYDTPVQDFEVQIMKNLLCKLRKSEALMVLKTWANSWCTSYRYHESTLLPCLFGCPSSPDKQAHYVMCPWLYKIVSLIRPETSSDPLERLAMKNVTLESLKCVACVFAGYHSIKCTPKHLSLATLSSTDSSAHIGTAVYFAEAFLALARDIGLQCRLSHRLEEHFGRYLLSQDAPFLDHDRNT